MALSTEEMIAFSQNMLTERAAGNVPEIKQETVGRPDEGFMEPGEGIENVEVSDDFVNNILGFSHLLESAKPVEKPKPKAAVKVTEAQRLEERITSLVERLTLLLKEAKVVIQEMTSTGSIGVGTQSSLMMRKGGEEYPPKPKKRRRKKA